MRNPERWRNAALAIFLAGPVTILAAFVLPESAGQMRVGFFTLGLVALLFGGLGSLVFQQAVKSRRRAAPDNAQREVEALVASLGAEAAAVPGAIPGDDGKRDPETLATCWKCGYQTYVVALRCPRCRENLQTRRGARRAGGFLVVLGSLLAFGMLYLLAIMLPSLLHPGQDIGNTRFDGTPGFAMFIIALLGSIAVFGFTSLGYGIFQMRTGRRSALIVRMGMVFFLGFMLLGFLARHGFLH